jgi:hypothetical protein
LDVDKKAKSGFTDVYAAQVYGGREVPEYPKNKFDDLIGQN